MTRATCAVCIFAARLKHGWAGESLASLAWASRYLGDVVAAAHNRASRRLSLAWNRQIVRYTKVDNCVAMTSADGDSRDVDVGSWNEVRVSGLAKGRGPCADLPAAHHRACIFPWWRIFTLPNVHGRVCEAQKGMELVHEASLSIRSEFWTSFSRKGTRKMACKKANLYKSLFSVHHRPQDMSRECSFLNHQNDQKNAPSLIFALTGT